MRELTPKPPLGVIDMGDYCARRHGPLLDALHSEAYFKRFIIEAGALGWPNGLELSPNRLYELCQRAAVA